MNAEINNLLLDCHHNDGASKEEIELLIKSVAKPLPAEYLQLLAMSNGLEGVVGKSELMLYNVKMLLVLCAECNFYEAYAPNIMTIGSNGEGENFGIVTSKNPPEYIIAPTGGCHEEDVIVLADSLLGFFKTLNRGIFED